METLVVGGGCFWCVEAVYQEVKGVNSVISGYTGGHVKNPCYREICLGTTGHAEVCKIEFDESMVTRESLIKIFFTTHNPTTLNRQGNDRGTQYRSVIYYDNEEEKSLAERLKNNFASEMWDDDIVTEINPSGIFYRAEEDHQNFFKRNPENGYCQVIISPKVSQFRNKFANLLK